MNTVLFVNATIAIGFSENLFLFFVLYLFKPYSNDDLDLL